MTKGEKKTKPDGPDQPLFGLLQRAWKTFATGAYTKAEIRRLMGSWGILTVKEKPLTSQSIDNLFRNPFYTGVLVDPWSGEECEGQHIPMVNREKFAEIQRIIRGRNRSVPHQKARPEFPLRGLVRCNSCSRYFTGAFSRGRSSRYPYYNCYNKRCSSKGKSYPVQSVHGEFGDFLGAVSPRPELIKMMEDVLVQVAEERQSFIKTKKARLETELARLNRQIQELIRMRTEGLVTDEEFLSQKSFLSEKRAALESRKDQSSIGTDQIRRHLEEIREPLAHPDQTWNALPPPLRKRFERLVFPVGFVNGKIRTAEMGLIFQISRDSAGQKSNLVALMRKFSNQILQEIKAFSEIFRELKGATEGVKMAVRENSREYPSGEDFEPGACLERAA